jgi:hypothetical protein
MKESLQLPLELKILSMHSIPCECKTVYMDHTGCSIGTKIKEHSHYICLYHLQITVVAEHCLNCGNHIQLQDTSTLARRSGCVEQITRGAITIELHQQQQQQQQQQHDSRE